MLPLTKNFNAGLAKEIAQILNKGEGFSTKTAALILFLSAIISYSCFDNLPKTFQCDFIRPNEEREDDKYVNSYCQVDDPLPLMPYLCIYNIFCALVVMVFNRPLIRFIFGRNNKLVSVTQGGLKKDSNFKSLIEEGSDDYLRLVMNILEIELGEIFANSSVILGFTIYFFMWTKNLDFEQVKLCRIPMPQVTPLILSAHCFSAGARFHQVITMAIKASQLLALSSQLAIAYHRIATLRNKYGPSGIKRRVDCLLKRMPFGNEDNEYLSTVIRERALSFAKSEVELQTMIAEHANKKSTLKQSLATMKRTGTTMIPPKYAAAA